MTTKTRILLIDNDLDILKRWQGIFTRHGYEVQYYHVEESFRLTICVEMALQFRPHIVVADMRLEPDDPIGDSSGLVLLQELKTRCNAVPVVIYSAYLDAITARRVQKLGGTFISKSDHPSELVEEVKKSIKLISAVAGSDELNINWPSGWQKIAILKYLLPDLVATTDNKFVMLLDDLIIQAYQPKKKILIRSLDHDPNTPPLLSTCAPAFVTAVAVDDQRVRDVVRITPAQHVAREVANYNSHILPTLNTLMPVKWNGSHSFWDVGVTMYELNGYNGNPLRSLWSCFQTHDTAHFLTLLRPFFDIWRYHYERRNFIRQPLLTLSSEELQKIAKSKPGDMHTSPNYPQLPQDFTTELTTIDEMLESEHWRAVTHGSFHCEYLLTDNAHLWPINFEKTGPSPIFRDFCQLELDLVLRTVGHLANEQTTYELMVALLNLHLSDPSPPLPNLSTKLVKFVKAFRQFAQQVTQVNRLLEYYGTLLLHTLTILLTDAPTLPLAMRRHAYLYTALLCERCRKMDVRLEIQVLY